jgi:predicted MFS family arabinose efflux permease
MPAYVRELREQWRPLLAAVIGLSSGYSIISYVTSIMAPHLLREFGWSKAEFAAVSSLTLVCVLVFPVIGRLTDVAGVKRTALVGVVACPIGYTLLSRMNGDIRVYIAIFLAMGLICITTTATVYSRVVVRHVVHARGVALAIVASGPAAMGVIAAPLLNEFVEAYGWRPGYLLVATFSGVLGVAALLLMPREGPPGALGRTTRVARDDYRAIFRNRSFWILASAMLLCNLPQIIALTQLNLMLLDKGVRPEGIAIMISSFAMGTLAGRFVCGLALDRLPSHLVACCFMALSSVGLFLMASSVVSSPFIVLSVVLIGLTIGAEGDLISYLVARAFGVEVYGTVMGMMTAIIAGAASLGAIILSLMLRGRGGFAPFLSLCGVTVVLGAALLLLLGRNGCDAPKGE